MKIIDISNFSGGIHEAFAPSDFTERQWTTLKGFFLKDETRLITQWPLQRVGTETNFREIRQLTAADGTNFIVGIKTNGEIWAAIAPANSVVYGTVNSTTWTRLTSVNGDATVVADANDHFLCETTLQVSSVASNKAVPALLINQSESTAGLQSPLLVWANTSASIGVYRVIKTNTHYTTTRAITSGVATVTISTKHIFRVGDVVTIANLGTDYNGTRTITGVPSRYSITFATTGADEASTADTDGTVLGSTAAVYPGYVPSAPSNVIATQSGGNVVVTWTNEYSGSADIIGYKVYSNAGVLLTTTTGGIVSTVTFAGTATDGAVVRPYNAYGETPFDAEGGSVVPATGFIPRANVGVVWSGQLMLGDIEYYKSTDDITLGNELTNSNAARVRNGIWFSNPISLMEFDPLAEFNVGNPDTVITGFTVLPQGLLVTTKSNTNDSGIFLLRGTNAGLILNEDLTLNFTLELVRGGMSTPIGANNPGNITTLWPAVGTVVFLDNKSLVWQTNTQDVIQLDQYGAIPPTAYNTTDNVLAWDRYLFCQRDARLIVMREFGDEGSWTELTLPSSLKAVSMCEVGNSLYFIGSGDGNSYVWRFILYPTGSAADEYGKSNGTDLDLTIVTRPVGEPNRYEKQMWHRIGIRARGGTGATLKSIESWNGTTLADTNSSLLTTTFSPAKSVTARFEQVVPAHGPSIEAAAKITLTGYVEVEAVTFYVHGKSPKRV